MSVSQSPIYRLLNHHEVPYTGQREVLTLCVILLSISLCIFHFPALFVQCAVHVANLQSLYILLLYIVLHLYCTCIVLIYNASPHLLLYYMSAFFVDLCCTWPGYCKVEILDEYMRFSSSQYVAFSQLCLTLDLVALHCSYKLYFGLYGILYFKFRIFGFVLNVVHISRAMYFIKMTVYTYIDPDFQRRRIMSYFLLQFSSPFPSA